MKDKKNDAMFRVMNDFVIQPRQLNRDVLDGKITRDEYHVLVWLRGSANPYATTVITLSGVNNDVFGGKHDDNTVNKILLSLKKKKYLYYTPRQGRRGSFEVKVTDFLLPTSKITTYEELSSKDYVRSALSINGEATAEVIPEVTENYQKSKELKTLKRQLVSSVSAHSHGRSNNNDTYNYKNKDNNRRDFNKLIPVNNFMPDTHEEEVCLSIAREVGETHMNFLLSTKDKYGVQIIEETFSQHRGDILSENIRDKAAFFNSRISENIGKKDLGSA